ncbi:MAG: HU family DNA-binding protein [Solirubrobacterales bacterium]|nr:HU family DNA-binding protein [Solirubrobacterales bacterium]
MNWSIRTRGTRRTARWRARRGLSESARDVSTSRVAPTRGGAWAERHGAARGPPCTAQRARGGRSHGGLRRGGEVVIAGFGRFSVSSRSARDGRIPATAEAIQISASKAPRIGGFRLSWLSAEEGSKRRRADVNIRPIR